MQNYDGEYEIVPEGHLSQFVNYQEKIKKAEVEKLRQEEAKKAEERKEAERRAEEARKKQADEEQKRAEERKRKEEEEQARQKKEAAEAEAKQQQLAAQQAAEQKAKEDAERNNVPLPSAYYEEHILKVTEENTMPSDLQPPKPFIYSRISFTEDSITAAVRSPCGRFDLLT